jgi:tetratricopeptide (TPR) repeat protein
MIISAAVIVKDDSELPNLKRCIASVIDYVDEVVVTANGKDVKGIEDFCTSNPKIVYTYHKWSKDFADQRNFNFSKVRKDADFVAWIDSDDVLVGGEYLRELAIKAKKNSLDAVFFEYWYACDFKGEPSYENIDKIELTQMRERLLRPRSITWKKRLHETPVPVEGIDYKYTDVKHSKDYPIVWLHLGVTRDTTPEEQKKRTDRNTELMEMQLADERKVGEADPRTLLYLMKLYAESNDENKLLELIKMGEEYLTKSGWDAERAACCVLMARTLGKLGHDEEAKDFLFRSIKEYPYDPIMYLYLSRSCFNLGQYHEMKHWLDMALKIDSKESAANYTNIRDMKAVSTDLMVKYYFNAEKNPEKAYQSMKLLYKEEPNEDNYKTLLSLKEINDLNVASREAHKLMLYYQELNNSRGIVEIIDSMPKKMQDLPFAWYMYNKHKEPRVWKSDEICYYATFGKAHFEQWGPENLNIGLGGSETAVIRLSKEWANKGYKVIVYCDCGAQEGLHDGVLYIPYYKFNPRDSFNIFINWRSNTLAGKIKAKKFVIDMHDLFAEDQFKDHGKYDKMMVKSQYHRSLAKNIPDEKFINISNGI